MAAPDVWQEVAGLREASKSVSAYHSLVSKPPEQEGLFGLGLDLAHTGPFASLNQPWKTKYGISF